MIQPFSATFVLVFLPLTVGLFALASRIRPSLGVAVLLLASAIFYFANDPAHAWLIAALVVLNYALGRSLALAWRPRACLLAAIVVDVTVLAICKYGWLAAPATSSIMLAAQGAMPLGLSFFVLQQLTWMVDLARSHEGDVAPLGFGRFALYATLFPQMVAGPILRYADGEPQYRRLGDAPPDSETVARGFTLVLMSVAKKMLLADPAGGIADAIFSPVSAGHAPSFLEAWTAGWAYLLQLYFDFSALSDLALGIGLMIGVKLPINFNSPLKARNATETFDRWHMSLTAFVRAYLFTPLYAVIRRHAPGKAARRTMIAWMGATLASLTIVGWWHGARMTFVLSGFLIGLAAILFQLRAFLRPGARHPGRAQRLVGRLVVIVALLVFGIFFRAPDLPAAGRMLIGLVEPWTMSSATSDFAAHQVWRSVFAILPFASIIVFLAPNTLQIFGLWDHPGAPARDTHAHHPLWDRLLWRGTDAWAVASAVLLTIAVACWSDANVQAVIYGQF